MSKIVASAAIRGAQHIYKVAQESLKQAVEQHGKDKAVEFPETAFFFPMAYALLGAEVKTLQDISPVLEEARSLIKTVPTESLYLPYLGDALDSGVATLLCEEIIERFD